MSLADEVLDRAAKLRQRGETFVVATVVRVDPPTSARPGDKALITADGKLWGWIGGSCSAGLVRRGTLGATGGRPPPPTTTPPATRRRPSPAASRTWRPPPTPGRP